MCTSANSRRAAGALALALASGCSLAPRYERPAVEVPAAYKESSADGTRWSTAVPSDAAPRGKWWELFGDPLLNAFEDRLSGANQNVAAAAASFLAARAAVAQARAQYFPTVGAAPGVTRSRVSATPYGASAGGATFTEYSLAFDGSWQPDFWGRTRNAVAASVFAAQASAADLENVRLSAHAELAVDYYQLRAQDALTVLLDSAAAVDADAFDLDRTLSRSGLASDQAVAQAEAALEAARAQAADAGVLRARYEHAIATLLGVSASGFTIAAAPFAAPAPAFPAGVPSRLLERRPDVASAERAVAGANAQIGVSRAAYFPNITLSASAGFSGFTPSSWLAWPSRFWSLGAGADETLFDGGLRSATVRQAFAVRDQAAAEYRQTVLTAFQQVEDGLASLRLSAEDVRRQDAAADAARRNVAESEARFRAGLDPYLDVAAARSALISREQTALGFRLQQVVADVGLIEALGGGWDASTLPQPKELNR